MDAQRTILIVALLVVSYLMVLAWNEDYGQQPFSQQTTQQERQSSGAPSTNLTATTPGAQLDIPESVEQANVSNGTVATTEAGTIQVETDVLSLQISRQGGNLVEALLKQHQRVLNSPEPLSILETGNRTYVLETALLGRNGIDAGKQPPVYASANQRYSLTDGADELTVDLTHTTAEGVKVTKRYEFTRGSYEIKISYLIDNQSANPWAANYSAKILRDRSPDPSQTTALGMQSFLGVVLSTEMERYEKYDFDDLASTPVKMDTTNGWIAFLQHYFVAALIPPQDSQPTFQANVANGNYLLGYVLPQTVVQPGETGTVSASTYIGPKIMDYLEQAAPNLDLTVDFGWLWFIAKPLFLLLDFFQDFVKNWGVAIILLTILIKLLFFPLSAASYRSMANMRRVAPELQRLKDQYGDDRQKMSQAMMEMYRKEKINPLGGCLPILVQMPVFIALYWVLAESVQLRHAPFMLWIQDLSVKDPYFILPLLMGATMFIQMSLNPTPPDPVQARVMKMMPIIFTVFFLWFPAGLVLYWLVNNILSIGQQWYITRQIEQGAKAKKA